jgi:hypothetical protein
MPAVYTPMETLENAIANPETVISDARNKLHGRE